MYSKPFASTAELITEIGMSKVGLGSEPTLVQAGRLAARLDCRCWQLGDCLIDEGRQRINRAGQSQPVRLKLLAVLVCLVERYPRPVSPDELLAEVWGAYETVGRQGVANAIWALRRLLGDETDVPQFIETIPRRGYRLLMPARLVDRASLRSDLTTA
jgi:DNA-binding winged helix-turn-helix (wHTH) protein